MGAIFGRRSSPAPAPTAAEEKAKEAQERQEERAETQEKTEMQAAQQRRRTRRQGGMRLLFSPLRREGPGAGGKPPGMSEAEYLALLRKRRGGTQTTTGSAPQKLG